MSPKGPPRLDLKTLGHPTGEGYPKGMTSWMRLVVLAALLGASFAPVRAAERAITTIPTVELSGLIRQSIPALSEARISVPSLSPNAGSPAALVVPAAFDTTKAQVLMDRVATIEAPSASKAQTETAQSPQQVIAAVNAVMKDFSADDIGKMSDSDIHSVSSLIMDQLAGRKNPSDMNAVTLLAQAKTNRLLAQRGKTVETLMNPGHTDMHPDDVSVTGTPDQARLVRPTPEAQRRTDFGSGKAPAIEKDTIFRHYTTADGFKAIMESNSLWNGFVPYVQLSRGTFKKTFREVSGLFFTLPHVSGDRVGVPKNDFTHYVDVVLPAKLPLLELEPGAIYLVPLAGATRDWVRDYYMKWTKGELPNTTYDRMIAQMDSEGGPGPNVQVPVKIVGSGKVR